MNMKYLRILGNGLFFVGIFFGLALAVLSTWDKIEAINYYFTGATYAPFKGLRCPLVMTPSEQGTVSAIFDNPADEEDNFYYRAEISGMVEPRRIEDHILVAPHGQQSIQWNVSEKDIDLEFFVFVKMTVLPNALHPTRQATCGITVLNFHGLTGQQIFVIALALSLLGMGLGLGIRQRTSPDKGYRLPILAVVVLLAMLSGLIGWWLMGIIFIVIAILLLAIFVRMALA